MLFAAIQSWPEGGAPTDAELMEELVRRESRALEILYDRHGRAVYSLVLRIAQQVQAAEEIVQDVFLQLWRNAHRYEPGRGPLAPWLFTLARNRALDQMRLKREKDRRREETLENHFLPCTAPNPESLADRSRRAERVRALMRALPERQRRAIELAYFDGLTHSEISKALEEPLGTVKSWIRTGLLRLREAWEESS